jgi:hypothetical protein
MSLKIVTNAANASVKIEGEVTLIDELLFEVFNKLPDGERETHLIKALKLGIHGYEIDEVATFISRAEKEVDVNLSILKAIRKTRAIQEQTTQKGEILELELDQALKNLIDENDWEDEIKLTGAIQGALKGRKVGDLTVGVAGNKGRIAIESKKDKKVTLGDLREKSKKDPESSAHGQLLLAAINRDADISIIVFDKENCHKEIQDLPQTVTFVPSIPGFIVKIQPKIGDYAALHLAYSVARELSLVGRETIASGRLNMALDRSYRDIESILNLESHLEKIEGGAKKVNEGVQEIRDLFELTISSFKRTQDLLMQEIDGTLSEEDWVQFFNES